MTRNRVRPAAAFGHRCPACRRWSMRLPGDSLAPVLVAGPRGCAEHRCGDRPTDRADGAPVAS